MDQLFALGLLQVCKSTFWGRLPCLDLDRQMAARGVGTGPAYFSGFYARQQELL